MTGHAVSGEEERDITVDQFLKNKSYTSVRKRLHRAQGKKLDKVDTHPLGQRDALKLERINRRIQHVRTIGGSSTDTSVHPRWKPAIAGVMGNDERPRPVKEPPKKTLPKQKAKALGNVKFLPHDWSQQPSHKARVTNKGKQPLQPSQRKTKHLPSSMPPLSFESLEEHEYKLKTWFHPS